MNKKAKLHEFLATLKAPLDSTHEIIGLHFHLVLFKTNAGKCCFYVKYEMKSQDEIISVSQTILFSPGLLLFPV